MGRRPFQRPRSRLRRRDPQDSKPSSSRSPRPPPRTHTALGLTRLLWRNALFLNTFVHVPPTGVCQPPGRRGPGPEPPAQQDVKPGAFRLNGQEPFLLVCDLLHEFAYKSAQSSQPGWGPQKMQPFPPGRRHSAPSSPLRRAPRVKSVPRS